MGEAKKKKPLANGSWKNYITYIVIVAFLIIMIILNLTVGLGRGDKSTLARIAFSCILAVSLNLVVGFLGELSLGHAGFMCVGAYLGCYTANILRGATALPDLVTVIIAMIIAGIVAAIFGFIIGLPALRLRGDYLAIATLAFGEIVRCVFKNLKVFGGAKGMSTKIYNNDTLFILAFIILLIVVFCCQNLINSKHGRAVIAIRDNEIAAKAMGVNVTFYKLLIFIVAAFFAGVAGVLYGSTIGTIRQETFSFNYSIEILVMVVLGGMGSINGSLIAATIITYLNILLQNQISGALAPVKNIVYALILIVIVIFSNAPALKGFRESIAPKALLAKLSKKKPDAGDIRSDEAKWDRIPTKIHIDEVLSADTRKGYANDPVPPGEDVVPMEATKDELYQPTNRKEEN
ncbi:MAG: branched-chain amino acid ABC transporter permease [Lachnospiraceae bacterium]|nr:branched-chain amino acid ABC transporter permease [Lachnospiraceae bacterium]